MDTKSLPTQKWDWKRGKPLWMRQLATENAPELLGWQDTTQTPQTPGGNPQDGFSVARTAKEAADQAHRSAQAGLPPVPGQVVDPLDADEGYQQALQRSGALTLGSKRPGRIGGKRGATFSSGPFKGRTLDQSRGEWMAGQGGGQSNLMPRVNRTPQQVADASPMYRDQPSAPDGIAGQPASPQVDRFMRNLVGAPAPGAEGPSDSPRMARSAATSVERMSTMLKRANSGAPAGGDAIASAQTRSPIGQSPAGDYAKPSTSRPGAKAQR